MKVDYRAQARQALGRAQSQLKLDTSEGVRYAALELRLAMEALTYDRAQAYEKELPPGESGTWQPRKLMQVLIDIDPHADKSSQLSVGEELVPGVPAEKMEWLGAEQVLSLSDLKKHYDAVGSLLHQPTMAQLQAGKHFNPVKARERCERLASTIEKVLASPVWKLTFGNFANMPCKKCGEMIRKRLRLGEEPTEATCFGCGAEYEIWPQKGNQVLWKPIVEEVKCPTPDCNRVVALFRNEIRPGTCWTCAACGKPFEIALAIVPREPSPQVDMSEGSKAEEGA